MVLHHDYGIFTKATLARLRGIYNEPQKLYQAGTPRFQSAKVQNRRLIGLPAPAPPVADTSGWASATACKAPAGDGSGGPDAHLGIHYRGVQWEGGAVDWGSIM